MPYHGRTLILGHNYYNWLRTRSRVFSLNRQSVSVLSTPLQDCEWLKRSWKRATITVCDVAGEMVVTGDGWHCLGLLTNHSMATNGKFVCKQDHVAGLTGVKWYSLWGFLPKWEIWSVSVWIGLKNRSRQWYGGCVSVGYTMWQRSFTPFYVKKNLTKDFQDKEVWEP
jgi:hypothetical protein